MTPSTTESVKIAILVSKETRTCQANGCMKAFHAGTGAFERYGGKAELFELSFDDGDLESRIALLLENGVEAVHLSSCTRSNNCDYETIAHRLAEHFHVIGYTHGSFQGRTRESIVLEKGAAPPATFVPNQESL